VVCLLLLGLFWLWGRKLVGRTAAPARLASNGGPTVA
jgi:hypothetical protein